MAMLGAQPVRRYVSVKEENPVIGMSDQKSLQKLRYFVVLVMTKYGKSMVSNNTSMDSSVK